MLSCHALAPGLIFFLDMDFLLKSAGQLFCKISLNLDLSGLVLFFCVRVFFVW